MVYDQEEEVKKRQEDVMRIEEQAKGINEIAGEIKTEIFKQDKKLDEIRVEVLKKIFFIYHFL